MRSVRVACVVLRFVRGSMVVCGAAFRARSGGSCVVRRFVRGATVRARCDGCARCDFFVRDAIFCVRCDVRVRCDFLCAMRFFVCDAMFERDAMFLHGATVHT